MKLIVASLFVASMAVLSGCTAATPAYTPAERFAQIHRNDAYALEAANDDVDNLLMLRPGTQLSIWNVYHRP
jgi:hypothetical protein